MIRIAILSLFLFSCSSQWHLNRAVKKGAELKTEVKHDTTFISESHYTIDTSTYTVVKYVPETRWKTRIEERFDHKRFKDSLRYHYKATRDTLNYLEYQLKLEKRNERKKDNRVNRIIWWFMIFFVILLIIYILGKTLAEKLFK